MPITTSALVALGVDRDVADAWSGPLQGALALFGITKPASQAMILAQCCFECARFQTLEEDLNYYNLQRLTDTFSRFFEPHAAGRDPKLYLKQPQKLASYIYADRFGNGDEASGDGFRYRGRGPLQVTFRDNYGDCAAAIDVDVLRYPELLREPGPGALSVAWFWHAKGLSDSSDPSDAAQATKVVSGSLRTCQDRLALFSRALPLVV